MRIQVVSDLHLEFHNVLPPVAEGADVLVCAGDLAPVGAGAVRYAAEAWAEARHVLYVPGNHEFYGADIDCAREQLAEECARHGITLLDPGAIVIDDVHFIGATLDRLVHSAYQLNLKGESMRKKRRPLTQTDHRGS